MKALPVSYIFYVIFIVLIQMAGTFRTAKALVNRPDQSNKESLVKSIVGENRVNSLSDEDTLQILESSSDTLKPIIKNKLHDDLFRFLKSTVFRDTTKLRPDPEGDMEESVAIFLPDRGKTIVNIYINKVEVFGQMVYDTLQPSLTASEKFGNSLHIDTKDRVIYENLIFQVGDTIQPFLLAANERILRSLPFIRDARIIVVPKNTDNQADIIIRTQDVFSVGISMKPRNVNDVSVSLYDNNLFGNGWVFKNTFRYRSDRQQKVGYEGRFDVRNIMGSFISGALLYQNDSEIKQFWLSFSKDYLTQETKYAGGVDLIKTSQKDAITDYQSLLYRSDVHDYWIGRSFIVGDVEDRRNIRVAARYYRQFCYERPFTVAENDNTYQNQDLFLGNLLLSQIKYFTSSLIGGFGKTEDIAVGYTITLTGGYSDEEFKNRYYSGLDIRVAYWFASFGYFAGIAQFGSHINSKQWEDSVFNLGLRYFSPRMDIGDVHFRHFANARYTSGFNRQDNKMIDIRDENGIRGLSHNDLEGLKRLVFNFESRAFTPWKLLGFQFTFFAFTDLGWISNTGNLLSDHDFFSAMGLGCRIRNEGLVFQTFNLRFSYYPITPEGISNYGFVLSASEPIFFSHFFDGKPQIIPYD